jgi:solute:Na+ symporter, SSS family
MPTCLPSLRILVCPGQLAGFLMAIIGLVVGSLGPQALKNRHGLHHHVVGLPPG